MQNISTIRIYEITILSKKNHYNTSESKANTKNKQTQSEKETTNFYHFVILIFLTSFV